MIEENGFTAYRVSDSAIISFGRLIVENELEERVLTFGREVTEEDLDLKEKELANTLKALDLARRLLLEEKNSVLWQTLEQGWGPEFENMESLPAKLVREGVIRILKARGEMK